MVNVFLNTRSVWYYPSHWLIICVLGLALYAQTFGFGFTFDDYLFIVHNPYIQHFDKFNDIWDAFPRTRTVGMYSFAVNYSLGQLHPQGYHIFNFIVHLLSVGLVWGLASLLLKIESRLLKEGQPAYGLRQEIPFIVALLFLVHPGQTQAITYITQRFESMATVFYLGAVYFYLHARLSNSMVQRILLFLGAGGAAVLGIMTKEVAVTIPLMFIAVELILLPTWSNRRTRFMVGISAVFFSLLFMKLVRAGLNIFLQTIHSDSHDGDIITPGHYLLTQMRVFLTFVRLLILPINQNLEYDYPMSTGPWSPPLTLVGMGLIALIIFLIIKFRRTLPLIAFGLSWVLITFSINLAPRVNVIYEHKLYLISFGFFLAITLLAAIYIRSKVLLIWLFTILIISYSVLTYQRNQVWRNELTLWEDVARKSPNKARVNAILGRVYGTYHRYEDSIRFLTKAINRQPANFRSYINRGFSYYQLGQQQLALDDFNKAIYINPNYFESYVKRSFIYKDQGQTDDAYADLSRAIVLEPRHSESYVQRGILWFNRGNDNEAFKDFENALKADPYNFNALNNRGYIYFSQGQYELALNDFNKALAVDATKAWLHTHRAQCLMKLGRQK